MALIPVTAVQGQGRRRFVNLVNGERRMITTGATDGASMVVLEGLEPGELLASSGTVSGTAARSEQRSERTKSLLPMGGRPRGKRG